jgi:YidC/Oxa1 family membrane protein insertase
VALVVIFYWPLLQFLGFAPTPEQPPPGSLQPVDSLPLTDSGPGFTEPTDLSYADMPSDTGRATVADQPDTTQVDSIIVNTAKYRVVLSTDGGGPVSILLKDFEYRDGSPIEMLPNAEMVTPESSFGGGTFTTSRLHYQCNLPPGEYDAARQQQEVVYTHLSATGDLIERKFIFYPEQHHFDLALKIPEPAKFGFESKYNLVWNSPLQPTEPDLSADYQAMQAVAMMGGSRETLDDFDDDVLRQKLDGQVTWGGVRSKYFAAVVIPKNRSAEAVSANGEKREIPTAQGSVETRRITVGVEMPFVSLNPIADSFTVFVGPLDYMMMAEYDVGLEDMLDIGTFPIIGWIVKPFAIGIMWIMPRLYSVIANYGMVIILFALLVKIVTLPLSLKSFKSMQAMKDLQPKIEELKKRHKKDAQKLNQETMKLYKAHGVNPMSGCLPILPQLPLFFALFSVFRSTILLRNAPFVWFIDDLSRGASGFTDPYMLLVVLMVVAQFVSQKFTMASTQQNKMLIYAMPLVMGYIFRTFAAGLVLYWTSFSILALLDYLLFKRKKANQVKPA